MFRAFKVLFSDGRPSVFCLCGLMLHLMCTVWAPSQYPKRRLSVRSRKVSKPRDRYFKLSYRFEIWQAHRQHCCRSACQISERSDNSKYKSRGFETLRDLTERRLFGYWDGALDPHCIKAWLAAYSSGTKLSFYKAHETLVRNFISHSNYYRYDNSDGDDDNNNHDDDKSNNNNNANGY